MTLGSSVFVAARYLWGRGKEGGRYLRGAALGIALSLVPIVVTLVVADGMIRGITDRYLELGTCHLRAYDRRGGGEAASAVRDVLAAEGVVAAWPERQGLGIAVGKKGKTGAAVRAVSPDFLADGGSARYLETVEGTAAFAGPRDVVLGEELARKIGASAGDTVRLMTVRTTVDGRSSPRVAPFKVSGIVSSGYRELDSLWFMIPYEAGKSVLPPEASSAFVSVKIDDPYRGADAAAARLSAALGDGYAVYTWAELQRTQFKSYASTRQLLLFIMALVVAVAAVNVSSATSMLAVERRRDVAVLKSFGADPRGTTRVFVLGAALAGAVGAAAGLALGLAIAVNVNGLIAGAEVLLSLAARIGSAAAPPKLLDPGYYLQEIPIVVDWGAIAAIGLGTVACSAAAAWGPARRAGALAPSEILRKY